MYPSAVHFSAKEELQFTQILETQWMHFDPKPIVMAERFTFYKDEPAGSESVRQRLVKLQKPERTPANSANISRKIYAIVSCARVA